MTSLLTEHLGQVGVVWAKAAMGVHPKEQLQTPGLVSECVCLCVRVCLSVSLCAQDPREKEQKDQPHMTASGGYNILLYP